MGPSACPAKACFLHALIYSNQIRELKYTAIRAPTAALKMVPNGSSARTARRLRVLAPGAQSPYRNRNRKREVPSFLDAVVQRCTVPVHTLPAQHSTAYGVRRALLARSIQQSSPCLLGPALPCSVCPIRRTQRQQHRPPTLRSSSTVGHHLPPELPSITTTTCYSYQRSRNSVGIVLHPVYTCSTGLHTRAPPPPLPPPPPFAHTAVSCLALTVPHPTVPRLSLVLVALTVIYCGHTDSVHSMRTQSLDPLNLLETHACALWRPLILE